MDWLQDFKNRFSKYPELLNLKASGFHGSVEINFNNGISMNYNLKLHRKACKIDVNSDGSINYHNPTLTKGGI